MYHVRVYFPTHIHEENFRSRERANSYWAKQVKSNRTAEAISRSGIVVMKTENGKVYKNINAGVIV